MAALNLPGAFGVHMPQYRIPNSLYKDNRGRLVELFSKEAPEAAAGDGSVLLFKGGNQEERYDTDHEPVFRQESFFAHLFGVTEADCYAVIEVPSGKTTLFIPRLPAEYAVWMGPIHPPESFQTKYGVDAVLFVDEVPAWLKAHAAVAASSADKPAIHTIYGENSDSGNSGPPLPDFEGFEALNSTHAVLRRVAVEVRVHKSPAEVAVLQKVNDIASDAHMATMAHAKPGMVEFQLESMFRHHCYYNGGCRLAAYTSICGCGPNAAVLHYGHAGAPNDRTCLEGEVMLSDQGCELRCYSCDITCSYPISSTGKFTADQRFIFDTVALCQQRVMAAMQPGVEWAAMHELTYRTICERLVECGALVGSIDEMMAANVGSHFMPHGLGHLIGIDTHDVGGYNLPSSKRDTRAGFKSLRMQRPLEEGMTLTVEPGCYFIGILLDQLLANPATAGFCVPARLEQLRGSGGVRLEDSVLVRAAGQPVWNLTTCPRTADDVEAVIAGKITSRDQLTRLFN